MQRYFTLVHTKKIEKTARREILLRPHHVYDVVPIVMTIKAMKPMYCLRMGFYYIKEVVLPKIRILKKKERRTIHT